MILIDNFTCLIYPLVIGFILDLFVGDPSWMPHPVRAYGRFTALAENRLNRGKHKKARGLLAVILLVGSLWIGFYLTHEFLKDFHWLSMVIASLLVFYGLANKELITEALAVEKALSSRGIEAARHRLSYIVGRDTRYLDKNKIRKAVLETLSENLSDGVIAPLFYYAIGGFPLMMTYKMINTLDSMIGYKNDQFRDFGYFAARLDDLFNLVPSRITAFLMALSALSPRSVVYIFKHGHKHASPNAGYPEAALAGILQCQFGGPNTYHGTLVDKPFIGENEREITPGDIARAVSINLASSAMAVGVIFGCSYYIYY